MKLRIISIVKFMIYLSVLYQNSYMYIKFHKKINKTIQPKSTAF